MRISTNTFINGSIGRLTDLQSKISEVQQQISSGKRITNPSDDPVAAAQLIDINQSISLNDQFTKNRLHLANNLNQVDATLSNITDVLQNINDLVIKAKNGLNSPDDKIVLGTTLQGEFDQLLKLANTTDSFGNFIFSGSDNSKEPFQKDINGTWVYYGSKDNALINVDYNNSMASTISGFDLLINSSVSTSVSNQTQDELNNNIFNQLSVAINALNNPDTISSGDFDNAITNLSSYYNHTLTQVNSVQSEVGSRLNMIDKLDSLGSSRSLQLTQSLSNLQDLDYTKAISDFSRQQTVLQAAQQTFAQTSKLSLFDYIK